MTDPNIIEAIEKLADFTHYQHLAIFAGLALLLGLVLFTGKTK